MSFWALMIFTFIFFIAPQTFFPALAPLRIALLTGTFAIMAFLFDRLRHGRPLPFPQEMQIIACLVALAVVTIPLSYWSGGSLSFLFGTYLKSVAIFWLLGGVVTTAARLERLAWALTLMTLPMAVTTLYHFVSGFVTKDDRVVGYVAPLTTNPNGLALVLSLILPLSLALFFTAQKTSTRALLLSVMVLDVMAVVITFSRAGFLTLGIVMVTYLYRFKRRERAWALAAICVLLLACVPLLPSGYLNRLATITDIESDPTGSAQERRSDTLTAVHLALANPIIGAGIGQNIIALNEVRGPTWRSVHNVYLVYAVDLGVPGLVLFVVLLARCISATRFVQKRAASVPALRNVLYLAEALQTTLAAFAVGAFFHTNAYEFHFYYFGGLAVALKNVYATEIAGVPPVKVA